jgi:hypothetical protein
MGSIHTVTLTLLCAWTWLVYYPTLWSHVMEYNNFGMGNSKSFKIVEIRVSAFHTEI